MVSSGLWANGILTKAHRWKNRKQTNSNSNNHNIFLVVSYTKGLSESFKNVCNKVGVKVHFKGKNTIFNLLVAPKDMDMITQKVGLSTGLNAHSQVAKRNTLWNWEGPLGKGSRNTTGNPSSISEHSNISGHCINVNGFTTVVREAHGITRTIKEALFIRVNDHPSIALHWGACFNVMNYLIVIFTLIL